MEHFSYVNIFETKGIEYLFVIGFLVVFVFICHYILSDKRTSSENKVKLTVKPKETFLKD